jgi:hypothetical protein
MGGIGRAQEGGFEQGVIAHKWQKRLGFMSPTARPETGAATAAEDDGVDGELVHYRTINAPVTP